jgi:hypothetical protein
VQGCSAPQMNESAEASFAIITGSRVGSGMGGVLCIARLSRNLAPSRLDEV